MDLAVAATELVENDSLDGDTVYDPLGVLTAVIQTASSIALILISKSSGIMSEIEKK